MFTNILYVFLLKFVVTNILKTSGIQFALPPVIRCHCTLKKKEKKIEPRNKKKKLESLLRGYKLNNLSLGM